MTSKAKMPRLGGSGKALWESLTSTYTFEPGELQVLELACRQADDIARLEALLDEDGLVVPGSTGRPRLSAVVSELRQQRLALARLLAELRLPLEDEGVGLTPASRRAQRAAQYRWRQRDEAG